ncbi:putative F-box protein At3g21120 [Cornus florida]|uniref:putative F-box protein At3g21120 n=1 Tax=Cornus florida TaxID=4283 RepID=UPI00289C1055|nr:putative F-box protein At3g21120 [Cornus florida]
MTSDIHRLPDDLMIDILSRLPAESVIRVSFVCKTWQSMVKAPSFVARHYNHPNNSARLFVRHLDGHGGLRYFSLYDDETLAGSPPVYRDLVADMTHRLDISLYDGIFCMLNRHFALWNPATKEFRSLPVFPETQLDGLDTFGFGLDPITADYKVIWIWVNGEEFGEKKWMGATTAVYSLSSDSWRYVDVGLPCPDIYTPMSNTCIDGVYHWFAMENGHPLILSFDLTTESFAKLPGGLPRPQYGVLTTYDNSLALCYYDLMDCYTTSVDVWVMRGDEGWTQHARVDIPHTTVLGIWKKGLLFIKADGDGTLGLYDPETEQVKDLGSRIEPYPLLYRESLVAIRRLNGINEPDQLSDVAQVIDFSR